MSNKNLRRNPHSFKKDGRVWWYEEPEGIGLYIQFPDKIKNFIIKWSSIRSALKRKEKS